MLAGHITQRGKIDLVEVEEPNLDGPPLEPGGGDIIVQPFLGCLCGSDVPFFDGPGEWGQPPHKLGQSLHELVGTVVATMGARFKPGDRVLAVPIEHQGLFQRFRLSENRAIPLDPRQPPEHALMAQPLGTALFALRKLPNLLDLDVAIVGQGPMGLMLSAVVRSLGARRIIAIESVVRRAQMSRRMGATHVIGGDRELSAAEVTAEVGRITDGRMAELVIEAVGHQEQAFNQCIDLCARGGRILYFGVPPETIDGLKFRELYWKNITVHTSVNPDFRRDFPLAMRWISEGRVDLSPLCTHRFPLAQIQAAYELFRDRRDGAIKVLIDFPS